MDLTDFYEKLRLQNEDQVIKNKEYQNNLSPDEKLQNEFSRASAERDFNKVSEYVKDKANNNSNFLNEPNYIKPKGSPGVDPKYIDAIVKQRQGIKLSIVPEDGSALVEGVAGVALPIAVHYANQATHGEFNPLDIKSAGEGSEVESNHELPYNSLRELYRQKKFEALK